MWMTDWGWGWSNIVIDKQRLWGRPVASACEFIPHKRIRSTYFGHHCDLRTVLGHKLPLLHSEGAMNFLSLEGATHSLGIWCDKYVYTLQMTVIVDIYKVNTYLLLQMSMTLPSRLK